MELSGIYQNDFFPLLARKHVMIYYQLRGRAGGPGGSRGCCTDWVIQDSVLLSHTKPPTVTDCPGFPTLSVGAVSLSCGLLTSSASHNLPHLLSTRLWVSSHLLLKEPSTVGFRLPHLYLSFGRSGDFYVLYMTDCKQEICHF